MFCSFTRSYTESSKTFYRCFQLLVSVESLLGSASNPDAADLFRGETATEKILYAAQQIIKCLIVLQSPIERAQRCCLKCGRRLVSVRGVDESAADVFEVCSRQSTKGGFTTMESVSVLPPLRKFDPPIYVLAPSYHSQIHHRYRLHGSLFIEEAASETNTLNVLQFYSLLHQKLQDILSVL